MRYPPPPWRLRGSALVQLQTVPIARALPFLPTSAKAVPVLPGRTLGGIGLARYEAGSTLEYHELIVIPALVRHGGRFGAWVSHIYVDDERSLAGGREIWALPKQLARFQTSDGATRVSAAGEVLAVFRGGRPKRRWRLPLLFGGFGGERRDARWFRGSGWALVGAAAVDVEVPLASPFAGLELGGGRGFVLDALNLQVYPPHP